MSKPTPIKKRPARVNVRTLRNRIADLELLLNEEKGANLLLRKQIWKIQNHSLRR